MQDAAQGHMRQTQIPPVSPEYRRKHRGQLHQQCVRPCAMCRLSCLGPGGLGVTIACNCRVVILLLYYGCRI